MHFNTRQSLTSLPKIILLAIFFINNISFCYADNQKLSFEIVNFKPEHGNALILESGKIAEVQVLKISKAANNIYNFEIPEITTSKNSLISLVLKDITNKSYFTKFIKLSNLEFEAASLALRACAAYTPPDAVIRQPSLLKRLISLREELLANRSAEIERILEPETLKKLEDIELGFGFREENPLSGNITFLELVERVSRIKNLLVSYRVQANLSK